MKHPFFACALGLSALSSASMVIAEAEPNYQPPNGYVSDKMTAIRVAEAVLSPIYGQTKIEGERPFSAELKDDTWHVSGHLPSGFMGGVAEVWISKRDARIVRVIHGQ